MILYHTARLDFKKIKLFDLTILILAFCNNPILYQQDTDRIDWHMEARFRGFIHYNPDTVANHIIMLE